MLKPGFPKRNSQTAETCSDGFMVDICWREGTRGRTVTEKAKRPGPDRVGAHSEVQSWCGQCFEFFPGIGCMVVCWEGWKYLHSRASQDEDMLMAFLGVPYTLENECHSRDEM